jgi:hypothetical protein
MNLIYRPILWPIIATIICLLWSYLLWFFMFYLFSWEILKIPMGLGGAYYYILFTGPILFGSLIYEFLFNLFAQKFKFPINIIYILSLILPIFIISILLIIFCPMDVDESYFKYIFKHFILK